MMLVIPRIKILFKNKYFDYFLSRSRTLVMATTPQLPHSNLRVFQSKKYPERNYIGTPDRKFVCWEDQFEDVRENRKWLIIKNLERYEKERQQRIQEYNYLADEKYPMI